MSLAFIVSFICTYYKLRLVAEHVLDQPVQCGSHNAVEDAQLLWPCTSGIITVIGPKEILWESLGSGGEVGMEPGLEL